VRRLGVLILALGLLAIASACAAESTPGPATSATFMPGKTWARTTTSVVGGRVAIVYVADAATERQVERLGRRVALLPEVERYAFMTKDVARAFFRGRIGVMRFWQRFDAPTPLFSLPMGYWLVLHHADDLAAVADTLGDERVIRRDASPFSGIRTAREFYGAVARINARVSGQ
jgi:hypothetical protein